MCIRDRSCLCYLQVKFYEPTKLIYWTDKAKKADWIFIIILAMCMGIDLNLWFYRQFKYLFLLSFAFFSWFKLLRKGSFFHFSLFQKNHDLGLKMSCVGFSPPTGTFLRPWEIMKKKNAKTMIFENFRIFQCADLQKTPFWVRKPPKNDVLKRPFWARIRIPRKKLCRIR